MICRQSTCCVVQASLSEMIPPGCLVMLTPVVVGVLFGTRTLAGVLAGALVSGVQMAVSMSNTGGAWDNAKKYVEVSTHQLLSKASSACVHRRCKVHCKMAVFMLSTRGVWNNAKKYVEASKDLAP